MTEKGRVQGLQLLLADEMEARWGGDSGGAGFWVDGTCFAYSRDQDDSTNNNQITRQSIGEASNLSMSTMTTKNTITVKRWKKNIDVYDNHDDKDDLTWLDTWLDTTWVDFDWTWHDLGKLWLELDLTWLD